MIGPVGKLSRLVLAVGLIGIGLNCADPVTVPSNTDSIADAVDVSGTWTGTESDRLGPALLTWNLTQTGALVSGTVLMRPVDPYDGSCASCHKFKDGVFTGTMTGNTLKIVMYFAAGGQDATPDCSITLNSDAATTSRFTITGNYSGSDPCEGTFDGTLAMTRKP